ncbi:Uncharacterised protein [uncultured archaeon]|nr:Uncharacterised protein [uncultured archaeon]
MLEASQRYALRKTSEEKIFLRNISLLESSYASEKDPALKELLGQQLASLKGGLSMISSKTGQPDNAANAYGNPAGAYNPPASGDRGNLSRKGNFTESVLIKLDSGALHECSCEDEKLMLKYYRLVLARHGERINDAERKTVGEIKSLVSKSDLTIQSLCQGFMGPEPSKYGFAKHYLAAAEKAYNYVRDEIRTVDDIGIGISFWLTPMEMVSGKIADDEDKAILLCSLLYCLGDENAEVVIAELENGSPHAFVITGFNNEFFLLDPSQGKGFSQCRGRKHEVMESYSFCGSGIRRFMYKFNASKYEQFTGQ